MKRYHLVLLLSLFAVLSLRGQSATPDGLLFRFEIISHTKDCFLIGDTVQMKLIAVQPQKTCATGLEKSRLFGRGIKITEQQSWVETEDGKWVKPFTVVITGNRNNNFQITAFRKTDKGDIIETFTFKRKG